MVFYNYTLEADIAATKKMYLDLNTIVDNCDCSDCADYQSGFILKAYPFLTMLKALGIDLSRRRADNYYNFFIYEDSKYNRMKIFGEYVCVGKIAYDGDVYFPVSSNGYRETSKITETLPDTDISFRFTQIEENLIAINFRITTKSLT